MREVSSAYSSSPSYSCSSKLLTGTKLIFGIGIIFMFGFAFYNGIREDSFITTMDTETPEDSFISTMDTDISEDSFSLSMNNDTIISSSQDYHRHPHSALPRKHFTAGDDPVINGFLTLVEIHLQPTSLTVFDTSEDNATASTTKNDSNRYNVKGTFCHINWKLQKRNPSLVPMFKDLIAASKECERTSKVFDLYDITRKAQSFDHNDNHNDDDSDSVVDSFGTETANMPDNTTRIPIENQTEESTSKLTKIRYIPPTGVVFHETRCGSTLTANLLAAITAPRDDVDLNFYESKVYSESSPPLRALDACNRIRVMREKDENNNNNDNDPCNSGLHQQLIQDVFYMMGRTKIIDQEASQSLSSSPEQIQENHRPSTTPLVFYKFQSITVHHIELFSKIFPDIPWMYLYRDSVEVLQSHLMTGGMSPVSWDMMTGRIKPVCARFYGQSVQPSSTLAVVNSTGKEIDDLTIPEYCAAHLAGLSESALQQHQRRSSQGRMVNYNQLPDIMWESILPEHFNIPMIQNNSDVIERMKDIANVYSKGRGDKANTEWHEDSTLKQSTADAEVLSAAHIFMDDIYQELEELAQDNY